MHVQLSPELEQFVQRQVESGHYGSATEVVWDALQLMEQQEAQLQGFRSKIENAVSELNRDEGVTVSSSCNS